MYGLCIEMMAQGKLSQQTLQTGSDQRISRTQKKRARVDQIKATRQFESLKAQAKQIQEERFKDKVVEFDQAFKTYRPKRYSERAWNRLSSSQQARQMRGFTHNNVYSLDRHVKRGNLVVHSTGTRKASKTIKFTLEDHGEGDNSYADVYGSLSPELKQFFDTPDVVLENKAIRINTTKKTIQEQLTKADLDIAATKLKYKRKEERNREWYKSKSKSKREKYYDRYKERDRDIDDDLDEAIAELRGYKKGLSEGIGRLNKGDDLSYSQVRSYAKDVGNYEEDKEEARNNNKKATRERQQKIDDLISGGYSPMLIQKSFKGKPTGSSLSFYNSTTKDYAKLSIKLQTKDVSKLQRSSLNTANISQSFDLGGKKFTFKSQVPLFKTSTGQLMTSFGGLGKTETQAIQEQRKAQIDFANVQEKALDQRASEYLETTGFKADVNEKVKGKDLTFWQKIKAAYVMTPFGTTVEVPKEFNQLRDQRTNTFGKGFIKLESSGFVPTASIDISKMNTLTWDQSVAAIKGQDLKEAKAEHQIELIEKFNKITEAAPEDIQFYVQGQGLSQLAKAGIKSDTFTTKGEIDFNSPEFAPSKSYNLYEFEKAKTIGKGATFFSGTRIVSTEALKMYGIGKAIGVAVKGVGYVGSKVYTGLGGGLKIADVTVKGGKATASVTVATGKGSNVLKTVGLGALGLGFGGLYTYSKVKQYQYSKEVFGKAGQEVFFLETGGEILGFGALAGESAMKRSSVKKLQAQIKKETYFKEARAEGIKNINKYGKFSKSAKLSYQQVGTGQEVMSKKAIQNLAKDYSKITGLSNKEATKIISEKGIYKQVFKVKSNVPSYERALKYLKTGKAAKTTTNYYSTGRYGIFTAQKGAKGSTELALDFKLTGSKPTNVVLKLTQSKGKYAVTNVFEKARYSPKDPMKELRLKEIFVTKASKVKVAKVGQIKFTSFDIENRLLKMKPLGNHRLTVDQALKIGKFKPSKDLLKQYWKSSGSIGKSSSFSNIKIQAPNFKYHGILKIAKESDYIFAQTGSGKAGLPMKNPRFDLLDDALREINKQQLRNTIKQSRAAKGFKGLDLVDDILKTPKQNIKSSFNGLGSGSGSGSGSNVVQMIEKKMQSVSTKNIMKNIQVSPSIYSSPKIKTAMKLDTIPALKDALAFKIATGQATQLKSKTKLKQMLKTRQHQQIDLSLKQALNLDLGLKQVSSTKQKSSQIQTPVFDASPIVNPVVVIPTITPIRTPTSKIPKAALVSFDIKKMLKMRKKQTKAVENFYYAPDFTSRALDLDPIEVTSLKQARKILRKVNTGFGVRRSVLVNIPD